METNAVKSQKVSFRKLQKLLYLASTMEACIENIQYSYSVNFNVGLCNRPFDIGCIIRGILLFFYFLALYNFLC